ncbi:10459_t:CDS:1, partial [Cetraspora pellucida]
SSSKVETMFTENNILVSDFYAQLDTSNVNTLSWDEQVLQEREESHIEEDNY